MREIPNGSDRPALVCTMAEIAEAPKKILCIENDRDVATLIAEELTRRGFEVLITNEGQEGLITILKGIPDLVLCDMSASGMSGFEVLARLNELSPKLKRVPFVFLAARLDRDLKLRARRLGANDFVYKPIDFEILHNIIDAQLSGRSRNERRLRFVDPTAPLSDREIEILTWVARGRTSMQIGKALGLVKRTVDFHLDHARLKLGARTRTEAVVKATLRRLIKP
jgi:DNA-binding NarL/FixJ family response regulator